MSFGPLMKFAVKHSCQYNENNTQKMYGKWKEGRKGGRKEEGRKEEGEKQEREGKKGAKKEGGREGGNKSRLSPVLHGAKI